jgi:pyruvate,orthophosphate dikinase
VFQQKIGITESTDIIHQQNLLSLLKHASPLVIHGNADDGTEARLAKKYGARGLEPRSEHMFFGKGRLAFLQALLISDNLQATPWLSEAIHSMQREMLMDLFHAADGGRVVIRLFDPPMHEFLPETIEDISNVAKILGKSVEEIQQAIERLREINPMMGKRGARLLILRPQLLDAQINAMLQTALEYHEEHPNFILWISVPMVVAAEEIRHIKARILAWQRHWNAMHLPIRIGVMIETPRAALMAHSFAAEIDFLSFGTNDLTAQTFSFSRGDCYEKFLHHYLDSGLLAEDPFQELDEAVVELLSMAVTRARLVNPNIDIGLCGEHGTQQKTVEIFYRLGCQSISCSPHRIPEVLFYAAQCRSHALVG